MNGLFQREVRPMLWFFAALIGIPLLVTLIAPKVIRFWKIDSCLDRGGRYNYENDRCEFAEQGNER